MTVIGRSNQTRPDLSTPASASAITEDDDEPNICGYFRFPELLGPKWQFYFLIAAFMVLTLLESANSTSTSTALVAFSVVLPKTSSAQLEWVGNSYMLAAAVLQLPFAALSDIFGRKPMVLTSFFLFIAGSAIAGAAHNIAALLCGRVIQGIGGAGTLVLAEVCIADLVALRSRARYYALISVMWAMGSGLGPLIGGGFTQSVTTDKNLWRWMFFLNLPIAGVASLIMAVTYKEDRPQSSESRLSQLKKFDWIGTFLITSSATSFILGLTFGGVNFPWETYHVLVPLILGLVGILGYGVFEQWGTKRPMLAMNVLFANRSATISYLHALIQGFMMEALPYYLPLFYQGVLEYSTLLSGVALLPYSTIVLPSSMVSGNLVSYLGRYKWVSFTGWAILTLGLGLLLLPSEEDKRVGTWLGPLFPTSIGLGTLYSVLGTAVQAPQVPSNWADAAAMMSFVRSVGEAMGVAVGGAIFASQMTKLTSSQPLPDDVDPKESIAIVHFINELQDSDPLKRELQADLSTAMHSVYYLYIGLSGLCLILNLFMKEYPLDPVDAEASGSVTTTHEKQDPSSPDGKRARTDSNYSSTSSECTIDDTGKSYLRTQHVEA